jgi:hypothetical protein
MSCPRPAHPCAVSADGEDLAGEGIFTEGEVEEFLADLYAMRGADKG